MSEVFLSSMYASPTTPAHILLSESDRRMSPFLSFMKANLPTETDGCFAGTAVVPLEEASVFVSSMDADSESVCGAVESCGAADGSST